LITLHIVFSGLTPSQLIPRSHLFIKSKNWSWKS